MDAATVSFFVSASVAVLAGLVAVGAREPRRSLAGFAVALAALVLPLVQLRAPIVGGLALLIGAVTVGLLGGLHALAPRVSAPSVRTPVFWGLAGLALLGFGWVLLATGSRQVVEPLPPLTPGASFGDGTALLSTFAGEHLLASLIVGMLALCSVIAAVLTLVGEREAEA